MSYSFTVRAPTKREAKLKVRDELIKVAANQDCHKRDKDQTVKLADDFIDLLTDDEQKDVVISVWGSLGGAWSGSDVTRIESANVRVETALATKVNAP